MRTDGPREQGDLDGLRTVLTHRTVDVDPRSRPFQPVYRLRPGGLGLLCVPEVADDPRDRPEAVLDLVESIRRAREVIETVIDGVEVRFRLVESAAVVVDCALEVVEARFQVRDGRRERIEFLVPVLGRRLRVGLAFDLDDPLAHVLDLPNELGFEAVEVGREPFLDLGGVATVVKLLADGRGDIGDPFGDDVTHPVLEVGFRRERRIRVDIPFEFLDRTIRREQLYDDDAADATVPMTAPDVVPQIGQASDVTLRVGRSPWLYHVGFDTDVEALGNPHVRRTIARLLDKAWIVREVLDGYGQPAPTPLAGTAWVPDDLAWDGTDPEVPFVGTEGDLDVGAARELFREIGFQYEDDRLLDR